MGARRLRIRVTRSLAASLFIAAGAAGWAVYTVSNQSTAGPGLPATAQAAIEPRRSIATITALGRIEPKDRVRHVAGPSQPSVVIAELFIEEGDTVNEGDVIAVLDNYELLAATVARLEARLENSHSEYQRHDRLYREHVVSVSERDQWRMNVQMAEADLRRAEAELNLASVRAPISGQVLKIHARPGERVGREGIAELGRTGEMYAIAEVYETDIGKVRVGQRAVITSPVFDAALHGVVERVGREIGKMDVLRVDPVAKTDARVVEVEIRLDEASRAAALTNLQVEVAINP